MHPELPQLLQALNTDHALLAAVADWMLNRTRPLQALLLLQRLQPWLTSNTPPDLILIQDDRYVTIKAWDVLHDLETGGTVPALPRPSVCYTGLDLKELLDRAGSRQPRGLHENEHGSAAAE